MSRLIQLASFACLIVLLAGFYIMPSNQALLMASGDSVHQITRAILASVIMVQILTKPPRQLWFRASAYILSGLAITWTIYQTYNYNMMPLDTLSILAGSFAILVSSVERSIVSKEESSERKTILVHSR